MQPLKILMVNTYLPRLHKVWGGSEREAWRVGTLLEQAGNQVWFFCKTPDTAEPVPKNVITTSTLGETPLAKIPIIYSQLSQYGVVNDFLAAGNFEKALDKVKPDVVHFHNFLPLSMELVNRAARRGIPSVLTIYDYKYVCIRETLYREFENKPCESYGKGDCLECLGLHRFCGPRRFLLKQRQRLFEKVLPKIDAITVLSENSRQIMIKSGFDGDRIQVIPLAFDFSETEGVPYHLEEGLVLFVGWIQPRKGIHVVIDAFEKLSPKVKNARLVIFGGASDAAFERKMKEKVSESGLADRVNFMGRKPYEQVREMMQKANVLVIAEQWPNMSPLTLIEGMAYRRGIVAGAIGGIPGFIDDGHTGFLVDHDDPAEYSEAMEKLLTRQDLAREIGQAAAVSIREKVGAKISIGAYLKLYRQLVQKRKDTGNRPQSVQKEGNL